MGKERLSVVQAFYDEEHTTADDCGAFLTHGLIDHIWELTNGILR